MRAADHRASKRFWTALLYGIGFWVILGLVSGGITMDEMGYRRRGHRHGFERIPHGLPIRVEQCQGFKAGSAATGSQYGPSLSEARSHVKVSVEARDTIYFHAQGGWSHGSIEFVIDDEAGAEHALVEVVALYDDENLLDEARVCEVSGGTNKGIELWTPDRIDHGEYDHSKLTFKVTFRLPSDTFNALNVSASIFTVSAVDAFKFGDVSVQTTNAGITFKALASLDVKLKTANGNIEINELKTSTGTLTTTNAHVIINDATSDSLTVRDGNGSIRGTFRVHRTLYLRTANGPIDVDIALLDTNGASSTITSSDANYDVTIETTNAPVEVDYIDQPRGSTLESNVKTTNSRAHVSHHAEYTGSFELRTTNAGVVLTEVNDEDREGKRKRTIELEKRSAQYAKGRIGWRDESGEGKKRYGDGSTVVQSTNGRVELLY